LSGPYSTLACASRSWLASPREQMDWQGYRLMIYGKAVRMQLIQSSLSFPLPSVSGRSWRINPQSHARNPEAHGNEVNWVAPWLSKPH